MKFKLTSEYTPTGDQPEAIKALSDSINQGNQYNTLLGVTGSGKTYTMAKVIEKTQKPTLIMTHNKTLAAQLYSEFRQFFPNNHVDTYRLTPYRHHGSEGAFFQRHQRYQLGSIVPRKFQGSRREDQ